MYFLFYCIFLSLLGLSPFEPKSSPTPGPIRPAAQVVTGLATGTQLLGQRRPKPLACSLFFLLARVSCAGHALQGAATSLSYVQTTPRAAPVQSLFPRSWSSPYVVFNLATATCKTHPRPGHARPDSSNWLFLFLHFPSTSPTCPVHRHAIAYFCFNRLASSQA